MHAQVMTVMGLKALQQQIQKWTKLHHEALLEAGQSAAEDSNSWHDNFVYEDGMRRQEMYAHRVRHMIQTLQSSVAAQQPETVDEATMGHFLNMEIDGEVSGYILCGHGEAALFQNGVSTTSPLGRTLVGMKQDERRTFAVGSKMISVRLLNIRKASESDFVPIKDYVTGHFKTSQ